MTFWHPLYHDQFHMFICIWGSLLLAVFMILMTSNARAAPSKGVTQASRAQSQRRVADLAHAARSRSLGGWESSRLLGPPQPLQRWPLAS